MQTMLDRMRTHARFAAEVASETLWPTRCALCDVPGSVLCARCASSLVFVDRWRACPRCGSAFGLVQCTACTSEVLARIGREDYPFDACVSALMFNKDASQLVRVFKDQGEQRLAYPFAQMMMRVIPPDWDFNMVTYVPATLSAVRYRGFDHAELIAAEIGRQVSAGYVGLLARPKTRDQRTLTRSQRIENLQGRFRALPGASVGGSVLLVDDVYTTGSTLCAAADALREAGASRVLCLTLARV